MARIKITVKNPSGADDENGISGIAEVIDTTVGEPKIKLGSTLHYIDKNLQRLGYREGSVFDAKLINFKQDPKPIKVLEKDKGTYPKGYPDAVIEDNRDQIQLNGDVDLRDLVAVDLEIVYYN